MSEFRDIIGTDVFSRDYTIPKASSHDRVALKISSTREIVDCKVRMRTYVILHFQTRFTHHNYIKFFNCLTSVQNKVYKVYKVYN